VTDFRHTSESSPVGDSSTKEEAVRSQTAAFQVVFKAESPYVWNTLKRLGVPDRDLEDVTHDVFMTVYRRFDDYDATRPVRPWLFGIAFRTASRYRDLARHQREVSADSYEVPDETPNADDQLAAHQARQLLNRALDSVDIDQRAAFVMHDIDGFSVPEIATALSIPLNTVYSRLRLARERVKAMVLRLRLRQGEP
jgi:RNA polymerase sigma-70 factor (ECF subfamily)